MVFEFVKDWGDRYIFIAVIVAGHVFAALSHYTFISVCDSFGFFKKYRLYEYNHDKILFRRCLFEAVFKMVCVHPIAAYFIYPIFEYFGTTMTGPLPSIMTIMKDLILCILVLDTMFYWVHRTLHHKWLYKYIHKQHHEFKTNIVLNAEFAHPIEDVFSSLLPFVLPPMILGVHGVTFTIWLVWRLFETQDAHSNYNFPSSRYIFFRAADFHAYHHSHNVGNYGMLYIWDSLMSTDTSYRACKKGNKKVN
jgi:fatty acid hydroxylase domain-containing protein 2